MTSVGIERWGGVPLFGLRESQFQGVERLRRAGKRGYIFLFRPRGVGRARPLPRPDLIPLTTRRSSRTALFVYVDVQRIDII